MTYPRHTRISLAATPYYHCVARCVRRAWLWGFDSYAGKDYSHRKDWVLERLSTLAQVFAIDTCAFAILSNHYHVVVRVDRDRAQTWTDEDVATRWSAAVLYGASWINQDSEIYQLSVDASGVQVANTLTGIGSNFEWLHYAEGLLYLDRGKIIDPAMGVQTGTLPFDGCWFYCRVVADAELDRIFVANVSMPGFWSVVQIYDSHTLDSLGHAALPYQSTVSKVVRWGDDGLAMSASTAMGPTVILLKGPLIAP